MIVFVGSKTVRRHSVSRHSSVYKNLDSIEETLRACKGFHQSATSAKLNPELRLF
jgi:hypothetical protein